MSTPEELLHKHKEYKGLSSGEAAGRIISTTEFKKVEFKLFLIGSDQVVRAYNELKRFFYAGQADGSEESAKKLLRMIGTLLLEIRKSVGNERTELSFRDAVWWFVKDADKALQE